jgi:muconolactone delta-isomerase
MLMAAMGKWLEKYDTQFEMLEFFVGGGGFGVVDVDDSADLQRMTAEHPFTQFSEVEIRPVVKPGVAMAIVNEALAALAPPAG